MKVSRHVVTGAIGLWLVAAVLGEAIAQDQAVVSIDEMEGDIAARWRDVAGTGAATLEPDEDVVKEGEASGRWDPGSGAREIYLASQDMPTDWEQLGALEMWVHSEKATGAVFAASAYCENPDTDGEDYYRCLIPVDWEGWRFFHLEPRSFSLARSPAGWRQIDTLRFAIAGWRDLKYLPGTVLRFDAIRLAKSWPTPERRIIFEPDTDWCAWWPLPYASTPTKTGRYVSDWYPAEDGDSVLNRSVPSDWSGSVYLNLWLYCEEASGATLLIAVGSDREGTEDHETYRATVQPDWDGWRLVSIPLSDFERDGEPAGWQAIDELRLSVRRQGDKNPSTRFCLDDIWLSTLEATEETGPGAPAGHTPPTDLPEAPSIAAPPGWETHETTETPASQPDIRRLLKEALQAKRDGNLELAFKKYTDVLLEDATSVDAHWGLAWVLAAKEEKEWAIEHFRKVVELSDDPQQVKEARAALARLKAGGDG